MYIEYFITLCICKHVVNVLMCTLSRLNVHYLNKRCGRSWKQHKHQQHTFKAAYFILNVACLYRCFPPTHLCLLMVGIHLKSSYLTNNYYHTTSTGYMIGLGSYNFIRQCIRSSSNRGLCMVLWSVRERRMAQ